MSLSSEPVFLISLQCKDPTTALGVEPVLVPRLQRGRSPTLRVFMWAGRGLPMDPGPRRRAALRNASWTLYLLLGHRFALRFLPLGGRGGLSQGERCVLIHQAPHTLLAGGQPSQSREQARLPKSIC